MQLTKQDTPHLEAFLAHSTEEAEGAKLKPRICRKAGMPSPELGMSYTTREGVVWASPLMLVILLEEQSDQPHPLRVRKCDYGTLYRECVGNGQTPQAYPADVIADLVADVLDFRRVTEQAKTPRAKKPPVVKVEIVRNPGAPEGVTTLTRRGEEKLSRSERASFEDLGDELLRKVMDDTIDTYLGVATMHETGSFLMAIHRREDVRLVYSEDCEARCVHVEIGGAVQPRRQWISLWLDRYAYARFLAGVVFDVTWSAS